MAIVKIKGYSIENTTSPVSGCEAAESCIVDLSRLPGAMIAFQYFFSAVREIWFVPFDNSGGQYLSLLAHGENKHIYVLEADNPEAWIVRYTYSLVLGVYTIIATDIIVYYSDIVNVLWPLGMHINRINGHIYVHEEDRSTNNEHISRYNVDGTGYTILFATVRRISWFSPDSINSNMWIRVFNLFGADTIWNLNLNTLISTDLVFNPPSSTTGINHDVYLDEIEGRFYEVDNQGGIDTLYSVEYPTPITYAPLITSVADAVSILKRRNKILFSNGFTGQLKWADRDGSNQQVIWDSSLEPSIVGAIKIYRADAGYD